MLTDVRVVCEIAAVENRRRELFGPGENFVSSSACGLVCTEIRRLPIMQHGLNKRGQDPGAGWLDGCFTKLVADTVSEAQLISRANPVTDVLMG